MDALDLNFDLPDLGDLVANVDEAMDADVKAEYAKGTAAGSVGIDARALRLREKIKSHEFIDLREKGAARNHLWTLPEPGECHHLLLGGDYNGFAIVPATLELAARPAKRLTIATLGFNDTNTGEVCQLIDAGKIQRFDLLCSFFFARSSAEYYLTARAEIRARPGCRVNYIRNHAKVLAFDFGPDFEPVVYESSSNLRGSSNVEHLTAFRSRALLEWHTGWIHRALDYADNAERTNPTPDTSARDARANMRTA